MTIILLIITGIVSLLAFNNRSLSAKLEFRPFNIRHSGEYYRFLSYALVHADFVHLAVNLFVLYSFGQAVEAYYGYFFPGKAGFYYLLLYAGGTMFSVLASYGKNKNEPSYSAVGASGAVSAIVFASILFEPGAGIGFLFLPFSIPAVLFGGLYLIYSAWMAKRGTDNIGHDAHFWGAIFGIVFTIILKPGLALYFVENIREMF